jgi:tetratricopeptide (TPR) repeat protein
MKVSSGPLLVARTPRFVGRAAEVQHLDHYLQEARLGKSSLVILQGVAGIGKTRLAQEICNRAAAARFHVLMGACPPGPPMPHSGLLGVTQGLGIGAGSADPEIFCLGILGALNRLLRSGPALVLIEDIQWADSQTLVTLQKLVRNCDGGVVFLITARTGEGGQGLGLMTSLVEEVDGTIIHLEGMPPQDMEVVLQDILEGEGEQDSVALLVQQSEGNPLQGIGMLRAVVLAGRLERRSERWSLSQDYRKGGTGLRETVGDALATIPEEDGAILRAASILGETFTAELVGRIIARPCPEVVGGCDRLVVETGLLVHRTGGYGYAHEVFRSVVYASIPEERRQALHLAAGCLLGEDRTSSAGLLSWHFLLGGDEESCLKYSLRAGAQCFSSCSLPEALAYYERAYGLSTGRGREPQHAEALEGIATTHLELSNYDSTLPFFAELLEMPLPPTTRARVLRKCAEVWNPTKLGKGNDGDMMRYIEAFDAIPEAEEADRGEVWNLRAITALWKGDMDMADEAFARSEVHFRRAASAERLATQLAYHVTVQLSRGDIVPALQGARTALDLLGEAPSPTAEMEIGHFLGHALLHAGEMEEAVRHFRRSANLASLVGDVTYDCWSHCNLALALEMLDDIESAWQESMRALDIAETTESSYLIIASLGMKAHLDFALEREEALRTCARLVDMSATYQWRLKTSTRGMVAVVQAEEAAGRGDIEEMRRRYEEAAELFNGASMGLVHSALTHLWFARNLAYFGDRSGTLRHYAMAADAFSNLGNAYMQAKVAQELATLMR